MPKDNHSEKGNVSRRTFLQRVGTLGAAGMSIGLLSHCGGESTQEAARESDVMAGQAEEATAGVEAVGECNDVTGLSEQAVKMREGLGYVESAPSPDKVCTNCAFWEAAPENQLCGGCQLLEGPIHPDGYCNSWATIPEENAG